MAGMDDLAELPGILDIVLGGQMLDRLVGLNRFENSNVGRESLIGIGVRITAIFLRQKRENVGPQHKGGNN